ncbi:alcohol dehydrogenase catalytic domain-containing protein [Pseudonocardia benzenivorans]
MASPSAPARHLTRSRARPRDPGEPGRVAAGSARKRGDRRQSSRPHRLPGPVHRRDVPRPEPEPGALVVDIEAATVCGSDVHVWAGDLEGRLPISLPLILGHEMAGRVTAIGAGADVDSLGNPVRIGDRVVWAHTPCGRCRQCTLDKEPTLCPQRYIGYMSDCSRPPHFTGTFAEVGYVVPGAGRLVVPDGVESTWAAAGSCAVRTVVRALDVMGRIEFTDTVLVQGAGPVGLFTTALASCTAPASSSSWGSGRPAGRRAGMGCHRRRVRRRAPRPGGTRRAAPRPHRRRAERRVRDGGRPGCEARKAST